MGEHPAIQVSRKEISKESVMRLIQDIKSVSAESKLDINQVIEIWKIAAMERANDLSVERADFANVNVSNICKLLDDIQEGINGIACQIENQ